MGSENLNNKFAVELTINGEKKIAKIVSGELDVNVQDQVTPPIDAIFAQEVSPFTISADTDISTIDTLYYEFEATTGHGIIVGNELLLLDTEANRSLQCVVVGVSVNTITIDRPIDHIFASASTLGRIVITNMNVVGSLASPKIFSIRAGAIPTDITRFIMAMTDDVAMDDGKFGGITALTNGLVLRIVNSYQKSVFNFKTNGDIRQFCYDVAYADKPPAGTGHGLGARMTFSGQDKHGIVFRIKDTDVIQWVVQDDLSAIASLRITAQGHETEGEGS